MSEIIPLEEADLPGVIHLELDCGLKTGGVARFRRLLVDPSWILLGAFDTRRELLGFFSAQVVVDELQIDNVAVRAERGGRGIGLRLVQSGLLAARRRGVLTAVLEVRASNVAAQKLYSRCGFSVVGPRVNYYTAPAEDGLTMTCAFDAKTCRPG